MAITIPSHPIADKVERSHSISRSNIVLVASIFKNRTLQVGPSSIPAHAFHCFQLASNSAFAASNVATWFDVRMVPGLLGA